MGLIRAIWREIYGDEPVGLPAYTPDWNETSGSEELLDALRKYLAPVDRMQTGDVLAFRMRPGSVAKHLAVVSDLQPNGMIIHAYSGHGVVETPLSPAWQRRIAGIFRFPDRS